MTDTVTLACHAKVNLFLRVLGRETDGYHSIETLFARIALHDTLDIRRTTAGISLEVIGADLGPVEENLAWRAADAVLSATGRRFGVAMTLTKRIPHGGGLGGGSSDAAQALQGVNSLADNRVPAAEILNLAARLGSDVPFFASGADLALGWGRGQRLLRLRALPPRHALLLKPNFGVATSDAYQLLRPSLDARGPRGGIALDPDHLESWADVARMAGNDFEAVIFGANPALHLAFEALARTRPLLCRMSGSGSTLFAVYRSEQASQEAADELGRQFGEVIFTIVGG